MNPELMALLQQLLTQAPNRPPGAMSGRMPSGTIPQMAKVPTETEQMMNMLLSQLQQNNPAPTMSRQFGGVSGGSFGFMGGRPPGT